MRINKPISDEPYCNTSQRTRGRWIIMATKKGCKTQYISYTHTCNLHKIKERLEQNGYTVNWKINDPNWIL